MPDPICELMQVMGSRGGRRKSPRQQEARRVNVLKALEALKLKRSGRP